MLRIETIQISRYKGIDNGKVSIVHTEIQTLKHLKALDIEKRNITAFNKKNHVNVKGFSANYHNKGFSANYHNYARTNNNYSIAEKLFQEQLELNGITSYLHEFKIQVKDALFNSHCYHLDFYIPEIKLAIEISPLFHFTYKTVAIRDKLRESLLKRKHGIKTIVIKVHFRVKKGHTETYLNSKDIEIAINLIKKLREIPHKETLNAYV